MKRKYKLLLSSIGLLSISTITLASVISCSDGSNNSKEKTSSSSNSSKNDDNSKKSRSNSNSSENNSASNSNKNLQNLSISNDLTNYFNGNNKVSLINYLWNNGYITYSNGTWSYNGNNYSTWASALSDGISAFIDSNPNISCDGVFGSNINASDISITSVSYNQSSGLVFSVAYNNISTGNNVTISAGTLDDYIESINPSNATISNALTTYFSNTNNQIALISYLLNWNCITYSNGVWNYNTSASLNHINGFTSWASALTDGITDFIYGRRYISYDGILGSNIISINSTNFGVLLTINNNASYNADDGLVFSIVYNGISAINSVNISTSTLNKCIDENDNFANALTTYFNSINNQIALIKYLLNNDYIAYANGTWTNASGEKNLTVALNAGISAFISANSNISYDGILGSIINPYYYLSITSASYSASSGLVFTITYNNISASGSVNISTRTLDKFINENTSIANLLTTYFSNTNNQITLISYLLNSYITYSNGVWNYNTSTSVNYGNGFTSWNSALSAGIKEFNPISTIYYDGILGSNIDTSDLSIINAKYSSSTGLVFTIAYNNINASGSVNISTSTLDTYAKSITSSNVVVANALTKYFSDSNNQMTLVNYLLNNKYITYSNGVWNYNTSTSVNNSNGYTSWDDALSDGISAFIYNNHNISYDGILGSSINTDYFSITNASCSDASGLMFTIICNGTSASSSVNISTSTLDTYAKSITSSNVVVANALTKYFSDSNNQIALIHYLLNNGYIIYSNETWSYDTSNYESWDSALSYGISSFIDNNKNISYDGILGLNINVDNALNSYDGNLAITNESYSASSGLVFAITYNGISASNSVTISASTLDNFINGATRIANALTTYFSDSNNQMTLINYLLNNNYITYSNETWSYDTSNYESWASALVNGISAFISNNQNISYDGVLGSSINGTYTVYNNATYSISSGLVFTIAFNGNSTSSSVNISTSTLDNFINETTTIANALTTYFSDSNNQIVLINYWINNDCITYTNGTWNYNTSSSLPPNYVGYTSWDSALVNGICMYGYISYDGILGLSINSNDISVTSASYSASGGLVFTITYNNISASGSVNISTSTLDNFINGSTSVTNALTTYFSNSNNQMALSNYLNYLVRNAYITYENGTWDYNISYSSWDSALSYGISSFIDNNKNISYDGILGFNINGYGFSIINAKYSASTGLVFTIAYNTINASGSVNISASTLDNFINGATSVTNALTTYFSNSNNQMALSNYLNYLVHNAYITYEDGTWNYDTSFYSSWDSALSVGISSFIDNNKNISYDGILGWNMNVSQSTAYSNLDLISITNISYSSSSSWLVFTIAYSNVSTSSVAIHLTNLK